MGIRGQNHEISPENGVNCKNIFIYLFKNVLVSLVDDFQFHWLSFKRAEYLGHRASHVVSYKVSA